MPLLEPYVFRVARRLVRVLDSYIRPRARVEQPAVHHHLDGDGGDTVKVGVRVTSCQLARLKALAYAVDVLRQLRNNLLNRSCHLIRAVATALPSTMLAAVIVDGHLFRCAVISAVATALAGTMWAVVIVDGVDRGSLRIFNDASKKCLLGVALLCPLLNVVHGRCLGVEQLGPIVHRLEVKAVA